MDFQEKAWEFGSLYQSGVQRLVLPPMNTSPLNVDLQLSYGRGPSAVFFLQETWNLGNLEVLVVGGEGKRDECTLGHEFQG